MFSFFYIYYFDIMVETARNVIDWDNYFINIADEVATRSKDPSTQVGAVIVDKNHRPVSFGYNGFLWAGDDRYLTRERPMKYYFSIHAEMNAILFSKTDLEWCTLYCNYACCENCLKFIIQSWIKTVIYKQLHVNSHTNSSSWSMEHPETWEAATRLILSAQPLGFQMKNLDGTPYLEELWWWKDKIPNFLGN